MRAEERKAIAEAQEQQQKEWTKNIYGYISEIKAIPKPNIDDSVGIERACQKYFDIVEARAVKPSVSGLALALGVNREILLKWLRGEVSMHTADIVREYYSLIEIFDETALKDNKTNAVAGVFNMKNNFGYKDEVEIKHIEDKKPTNKEIEEKYRQMHQIVEAVPHEIDYTDNDNSSDN